MIITGRGTSGSFQIRGHQLGAAMGARVGANLPRNGLTIMVKKGNLKRVVWDVIDAFPQPASDTWGHAETSAWFDMTVKQIEPIGIVAATRHMADDAKKYGVPVLWLPHHCRPGLERNRIREDISRIGYEGSVKQLGKWKPIIEAICLRRGWEFVINPPSIASLDIVLAFREARGYPARFYKSNVKLANAQGSGTPVICNREAGYLETSGIGECWADTESELEQELDRLTSHEERFWRAADLYERRLELKPIAEKYKAWLLSNF